MLFLYAHVCTAQKTAQRNAGVLQMMFFLTAGSVKYLFMQSVLSTLCLSLELQGKWVECLSAFNEVDRLPELFIKFMYNLSV